MKKKYTSLLPLFSKLCKFSIFGTTLFLVLCCTNIYISRAQSDPYWNDMAQFLAGIPVRSDSGFFKLAQSAGYKQHSVQMNSLFLKIQSLSTLQIIPWRDAHIPRSRRTNTAFYPFSGADFVNLYTFFPFAENYIMVALEDPGPLPEPYKLNPSELSVGLSSLQRNIQCIADQNYFQNIVMRKEIVNRHIKGMTPVLLVFASRMGLTILAVEKVGLDPSGVFQVLNEKGLLAGVKPKITGTKIVFMNPRERRVKNLLYVQMALGNQVMKENSPEGQFFRRMKKFNTMIKSAIYLLHYDSFRDVQNFILSRSELIAQDDSGIPFKSFDRNRWKIELFGTFSEPFLLRDLPNPPHQPDLAAAYKLKSEPLDFNFGYGVWRGKGRSNLMLAIKK